MNEFDRAVKIDITKAVEAIVYIASKAHVPDIYHVGKILYFADIEHLQEYGRLICGDRYVAMKDGPVPSAVYDFLKDVRDERRVSRIYHHLTESFAVAGRPSHKVTNRREADLSVFSDSDIECLDRCIEEYGAKSFGELKAKSHDRAYDTADLNDDISLEAILDSLPSPEPLKQYILQSDLG